MSLYNNVTGGIHDSGSSALMNVSMTLVLYCTDVLIFDV